MKNALKSLGLLLLLILAVPAWAGSSFELGAPVGVGSGQPVLVLSPSLVAASRTESSGEVADSTRVSIDLILGLETLARLGVDIAEFSEGRASLQLEAVGGGTVGVAGITPAVGGGVRVRLEVLKSANGRNALLIGPGLNVLVAWDSSPEDAGMVDLGPDSTVVLLAPSVDIAWVHQFSRHFGLTLGLHAGAQVAVAGIDNIGQPIAGRAAPVLSFFTGVRF